MGRRSKVLGLPPEVKAWLDAALIEGNFSGYELLAAELKARGCEVSKSSLQRYGQPFEQMMKKLKLAGEQAQALMTEAGDDKGAMNDALIRMIQQKTFELLLMDDAGVVDEAGKVQPSAATDPKFVRAIATLVRASVTQKEWAAKLKTVLDAQMEKAEAAIAEGKNPQDVLAAIRQAYTGAM